MEWKKTIGFLSAFVLMLSAAHAVNYLGNAHNLFPVGLHLSDGDRAWKARQLRALTESGEKPEALILGSSRALEFDPAQIKALTGLPTFNFAVGAGNSLDCHAILRYALDLGIEPRLILINVDEGMLLRFVDRGQLQLAGDAGLLKSIPSGDKPLIAWSIFQGINVDSTWKNLVALSTGKWSRHPKRRTFIENGYQVEFAAFREKERGDFNLAANIRADVIQSEIEAVRSGGQDARPRAFDANCLANLIALLDLAKERGSRVFVIITPEHPSIAETIRGRPRREMFHELQQLLQSECEKRGFEFRDFSKLETFGGDPDEFWDSTHQTPSNMRKLVNVLFDRLPDENISGIRTDEELVEEVESKAESGVN